MPANLISLNSVFHSVKEQDTNLTLVAQCKKGASYCGLIVALLGIAVLFGWLLDIAALKSMLPDEVMMKANTALGFVIAGAALLAACRSQTSQGAKRAHVGLAALLTLLGLLTLGEFLLAADFGIDQLLFTVPFDALSNAPPGRMAVTTAIAFIAIGAALLLLDSRSRFGCCAYQLAAFTANLIGLLAVLGYAYDVGALHGVFAYSTVALHTALAVIMISVGILLARPKVGLMGIVTSNTTGGLMARRLLPIALMAPFLIGWLRVQADHLKLVSFEFGVAMVTVTYMVVFFAFIWRTGSALRQSDLNRLATNELRLQQQAHMSGIITSAMDAIIMVNAAQRVVLFNPAAEQMFGHPAAGILGETLERLLPQAFRAGHAAHIQSFGSTGATQRRMGGLGAITGLRANGEAFPIEASISTLNVSGETFYTVILRDITLRAQMETQLKSTIGRMQMAVKSTGIGIWVWHLDTNDLDWDQRMFDIYGAPNNRLETRLNYDFWRSRVHPDDVEVAEHKLTGHIAGTDTYNVVFRIVLDDGSIRFIQAAGLLEHDDQGRPSQMVGTNRDITDIREAQRSILEMNASLEQQVLTRTQELQHLNETLEEQVAARSAELNLAMDAAKNANSAKSDFLANMSHEIRTPMNAILGLAYLLERQPLAPTARSMVSKIHNAGRSLLGIINDILDFSKVEANQLEIENIPFRLSDVLDNLANIMSPAVGTKNIEVVVAPVPHGADYLRGDPLRLGQILINLAGNAIKFTQQGEVVLDIECMATDTAPDMLRLRFSVRDTGVGIPQDKQDSIFRAFSQADTSTTRTFGGTGLGLTISRHLVELMGGSLTLTSEVGVGSEFSFALTFEVSPPCNSAMPSMAHQRILIADDNETARTLLAANASSLGWSVQTADSGEQAIAMTLAADTEHKPFDVLLLDWRMPGTNGIEAAAAIRGRQGDDSAQVIVMVTAHDREILLEQPGHEVADVIVPKPLTSSALFNAVMDGKSQRGTLKTPPERQSGTNRLRGIKVLVVDDSVINREVAYQILSGEGAEIELAADGSDALLILNAKPDHFDIVLMDIQMPVMDGYAATREIRCTPSLQHLPVIALTAGAFKIHQAAALNAGMDDFIAKPFDVDDLVTCVQQKALGTFRDQSDFLATGKSDKSSKRLDLAELLLLDVTVGLQLWRVTAAYKKHLGIFMREHALDAQQIEREMVSDQTDKASAMAHKLRGAAGALSLPRLAQIAGEIEDSLSVGIHDADALNWLAPTLAHTLEVIQDFISGQAAPADEVKTLRVPPNFELKDTLIALLAALDSDDPSHIEPLLPALAGVLPQALFEKIVAAVDAFDFRGAQALVNRAYAKNLNEKVS